MMHAGKLRTRITIQQDTGTQDAAGQHIPAWTLYKKLWASRKTSGGIEGQQDGRVDPHRDIDLEIRYFVGLTPKMRVTFGSRTLAIDSIHELDDRRQKLLLRCREVQ